MVNYFKLQRADASNPSSHLFTVDPLVGPISDTTEASQVLSTIAQAYYDGVLDLPQLVQGRPLPPDSTRIIYCNSRGNPLAHQPSGDTLANVISRFRDAQFSLPRIAVRPPVAISDLPDESGQEGRRNFIQAVVDRVRQTMHDGGDLMIRAGWVFARYNPEQTFSSDLNCTDPLRRRLIRPECLPDRVLCNSIFDDAQRNTCFRLDGSTGDVLSATYSQYGVVIAHVGGDEHETSVTPISAEEYHAAQAGALIVYRGDHHFRLTPDNTYTSSIRILFDAWGVVHGVFYQEVVGTTHYEEEDRQRNGYLERTGVIRSNNPHDIVTNVVSGVTVSDLQVNTLPDFYTRNENGTFRVDHIKGLRYRYISTLALMAADLRRYFNHL